MFLPRFTLRNRFDKLLNGHGDHKKHKRKRCAKKKCKQRSEWSYIHSSTANLDVSPFCVLHACQWREANGVSCRHSKKSNQLYCKYHLACQAAPYGRQCTSERSNPLNRDAKFCELHACRWAGCNNEIKAPEGQRSFTYCKDHNCQQADCVEARIGATGTRQSVYCANHTCKNDNCMANVHGTAEVGDTKSQHLYCPVHRPCKNADCNSMVHRVSNAEFRKHCSNHYCEFGNNCDEERSAGAKVCNTHRCKRSGCAKQMQNVVGRYCEDHECKDATKPCLEERFENSEWCVSHICREYLGTDKCRKQGESAKDHYCTDHVRCDKAGCDKKVLIDDGKHRQFCEDHFRGMCEFPSCDKPRAWSSGHKHHCSLHACLAHPDCGIARTMTSLYCTRHKCSDSECETIRASAKSLSPSSLKQFAGLASGASLTAASLYMYDPWCAAHRCRETNCSAQAVAQGSLCATHLCREPGCGTRAVQDNGYCDQHACRERGCLRAPIDANHAFCDLHCVESSDSDDDDHKNNNNWGYGGPAAGSADFNGLMAAPGWSGPFGLGGAGPQPRKHHRRRRSRSRSRSRSTQQQQQQHKSRKSGRSRSRTRNSGGNNNNNANAGWNSNMGWASYGW